MKRCGYPGTAPCIKFFSLALLLAIFLIGQMVSAQESQAKERIKRSSLRNLKSERYITIDFNNVDIVVFIKFISELTGRNFIIDQRVRGKVTIISPSKISLEEAYKVFESVLEVHGYTTVEAGKVTKIVPAPDARTKSIETKLRKEAISGEDRVVTQLIPLRYANPNEIKRLFAPLVSKNSVILSYPPTNMLILTDVYSNVQRLLRIIEIIDVAKIGLELSVIPLEYADATKFAKLMSDIFRQRRTPRKGEPDIALRFVADERTNTIILLASEQDTHRVKRLIGLLDRKTPRGKEKIRVYYLEHANAEELAKVLQSLPTKTVERGKGKKPSVVAGEVSITADKATNSLIIMAGKDDYQVLEDIIKQLDIPRAMVYIESLIMEVSVEKGFQIGVRWRALGQTNIQDATTTGGGAFSGGSDNIDENTILEPGGGGFALGVISGAIDIVTSGGTITVPNVAAIASAFESDRDVHILSTPQILTTDNEEARIVVGRNVPFRTRSTQIEGTAQTFASFEYRDVGLTLKITPQISKDRQVRLNISQELTALADPRELQETDFRPTTLKRSIDTTVVVEDGSTVVIGGLIDETFTQRDSAVPCLGNIPGLGWLFRQRTQAAEKTNLFVFLSPRVIKNKTEAADVYLKKKEEMSEIKEGKIKMYEKSWYFPEVGIPLEEIMK
ncbi:MAG: type II secretion system secretin GspD [Deltaproteobacteria bacterium]|nr:type II secretion system secretin GspD [Deltaproteobacteria bacterium]MBW2151915.1 type II secretion system secretin GspD [Deltaproteobacteria bacterium]